MNLLTITDENKPHNIIFIIFCLELLKKLCELYSLRISSIDLCAIKQNIRIKNNFASIIYNVLVVKNLASTSRKV